MNKSASRIAFVVIPVLAMLLLNSCMKQWGRQFATGAQESLSKTQVDSLSRVISQSAAKGILEVAMSDSVQARLRMQLDSIGQVLDKQAGRTATHLRDSVLLTKYTELWIQNVVNASGESLLNRGNTFLDNIRGEQTQLFVARLRDELLNDITLQRAAAFRNELLGDQTSVLVDSLVQRVARGLFNNQINPSIQSTIAAVELAADEKIKDARRMMYLAGLVALLLAGVAFYIYRQSRKHKQTLKIITRQIDSIPDQTAYDHLVRNIKHETVSKGLEPHLQAVLKEEQLYQQPQWQNKDYQVLHLVTQYLHDIKGQKQGQEMLQDLTQRARSAQLDDQLNSMLNRVQPNDVYQSSA